jgi:autotransporter-associated beta strand protein/T5SS/PEP-CTERM-associated repeat protein
MNRNRKTVRHAALALGALAVGGVSQAATFTASSEAELIAAINQANASTDPSSTITLTAAFTVTTALPPIRGNVRVDPGGQTTAVGSASGGTLTFEAGASYGTLGNLQVGHTAGSSGALTVRGAGTSVRTSSLVGNAGLARITVLDGAVLAATGPAGVRFGGPSAIASAGGVAHVLVNGAGSALTSGIAYVHQRGTLEVSGGGALDVRAVVNLGSMPGGFTGVITGAGSRLTSTSINLGASGSATLTVADGAVVSADNGAFPVNLAANVGGSAVLNIGGAVGQAAVAPGTVLASAIHGGAGTAVLNFNHNAAAYGFAPAVTGSTSLNHVGSGTTTLSGASTYSGATNITGGTLRAGVANAFSAASAHTVGASGALDASDFNQTLNTLNNAGTVSLPGGTLTMTGAYVGNGGTLRVGTAPGAGGLASGRLVLAGPGASATGTTLVGIANFGGLGAPTTGDGIEVITATGGATTTAQTTRDAFRLATGAVGGGAYQYRLYAADASGAGENWYLRSEGYRAEVALYAVVPEQFRALDAAMLANRQQRMGELRTAVDADGRERQAWGRVFSVDRDIAQQGTVSPTSNGRLNGFQTGTDLWTNADWRAGLYIGQLEGDMDVKGQASGAANYLSGRNELRSQYLGAYATWQRNGLSLDAVLQAGRHRYTATPGEGESSAGKGDSLMASVELGHGFALTPRWQIEPSVQLAWQHLSLDDTGLGGATVQQDTDDSWIARAGVRVKGLFNAGPGALRPYAGLNVYQRSNSTDTTRFLGGAGGTDITSRTGGSSGELSAGAIWQLSPIVALFGEVSQLWDLGGDARTDSGISGSVGVRVLW